MAGTEPSIVDYEWQGEKSHVYFFGKDRAVELRIDVEGIAPADVGSLPLQLMGASAVHCLAGTVAAFILGRGGTIRSLRGRAIIEQGTNDQRRVQASSVRVEVDVDVEEKDASLLEKARKIIEERGCLVTYSLERGMKVEHVINRA